MSSLIYTAFGATGEDVEADLDLGSVLSEDWSDDAKVTSHPVEKGADIADHVRPEPLTCKLEGIISSVPVGGANAAYTPATGVGGKGEWTSFDFAPTDIAQQAAGTLSDIKAAGLPVTVKTSRRQAPNMVLEHFGQSRDSKIGDALKYSLSFREVRLVTTLQVAIPVDPRAGKKTDRGAQVVKDASAAESAEADTAMASSADIIFGKATD